MSIAGQRQKQADVFWFVVPNTPNTREYTWKLRQTLSVTAPVTLTTPGSRESDSEDDDEGSLGGHTLYLHVCVFFQQSSNVPYSPLVVMQWWKTKRLRQMTCRDASNLLRQLQVLFRYKFIN